MGRNGEGPVQRSEPESSHSRRRRGEERENIYIAKEKGDLLQGGEEKGSINDSIDGSLLTK